MSKLQDIENKLASINDAVFQNVCDAYLFHTEKEYPNLFRSGSQKGKQKTVKGTPDTFFKLVNGKYVLVEYTTKEKNNKNAFLKKIKADIEKCLDQKSTGIKISNIQKIIYCHNSTLTTKESTDLIELYKSKKIKLELRDLGAIALGIYGRCPEIAKEFLGITLDTAQVLTPDVFIKEYSATGFATPLNNKLFFRENELKTLVESINNSRITILTGSPGVGKSRLALAAFEELKKDKKKKYRQYCISNKNSPIYDDIRSYFKSDQNILVLIDDANRQLSHLSSILPLLSEERTGEIKLIITVRDYAYDEVNTSCAAFEPSTIAIKKLTDDQLTAILKSEEFNITNPDYYRRILEIADGNPRLAIMAALIAKKEQTLKVLIDVSDIYDKYFSQSINDKTVFTDKILLKTMGLISFFYSIDRSDSEKCGLLLKQFGLDYYEFNEAISKLENLELLETSNDQNIVKISEQILSTYFFYKAFLKDGILDFSIILNNYFETHYHRIKDTVIPANNTFGYENVYEKLTPFLNSFWQKVKHEEENAIQFLQLFWAYRANDVFAFVYEKTEKQPAIKNVKFINEEKSSNRHLWNDSDKCIDLLTHYFHYPSDEYIQSLELSFEYVKKNPSLYTHLVKSISETLIFSHEDSKQGFYRQEKLIEYIISKAKKKDALGLSAFFDVIPKFMRTSYNVVSSGRRNNTVSFYSYTLPANDFIKKIRNTVWNYLSDSFKKHPTLSMDFLFNYLERSGHDSKEVYEYDLGHLIKIINTRFDKENFEHCYLVNDLFFLFKRLKINDSRLDDLKSKFSNKTYKYFRLLDHNRLKDKESFDFANWDEYRRLKEQELKKEFEFKSIVEFTAFYKIFLSLCEYKRVKGHSFHESLDTILHFNFEKNNSLGLKMFQKIIEQKNTSQYVPWASLNLLLSTSDKQIENFHALINSKHFNAKASWLLRFYRSVPPRLVRKDYVLGLLDTYEKIDYSLSFSDTFSFLEKFKLIEKNIYSKVLAVIVRRNEEKTINLPLDHDFFEQYSFHFEKNIGLLKKAYFQQDKLSNHYDFELKGFISLLKLDNKFLIEYLKFISKDRYSLSGREYPYMSIIWSLPNAEVLLTEAMNFFSTHKTLSLEDHFANTFFKQLSKENSERALKLLNTLLKKNKTNINYINLIFDVIRHTFKDQLPTFIQNFLLYNNNIELFKKINWLDSMFSGNADTIWGDVKAVELNKILESVNQIKKGAYKYAKHKAYLEEEIAIQKRQADGERKRKFTEDRW